MQLGMPPSAGTVVLQDRLGDWHPAAINLDKHCVPVSSNIPPVAPLSILRDVHIDYLVDGAFRLGYELCPLGISFFLENVKILRETLSHGLVHLLRHLDTKDLVTTRHCWSCRPETLWLAL